MKLCHWREGPFLDVPELTMGSKWRLNLGVPRRPAPAMFGVTAPITISPKTRLPCLNLNRRPRGLHSLHTVWWGKIEVMRIEYAKILPPFPLSDDFWHSVIMVFERFMLLDQYPASQISAHNFCKNRAKRQTQLMAFPHHSHQMVWLRDFQKSLD